MKSRVFTKRMFSLELSEEELSIIAGALFFANSTNIKCFVDQYKYPGADYSFDEVAELQEKLSEEVNKLIEGKKE